MDRILLSLTPLQLKDYIDWNFMFVEWDLHGRIPEIFADPRYGIEAKLLYDDAQELLSTLQNKVYALYLRTKAYRSEDDIVVVDQSNEYLLPQLRNQTTHFKCLSDYIGENSEIILFAITTKNLVKDPKDDYRQLMSSILCDRLADAMLTYLEDNVAVHPLSIAYGYPAAPDHSGKKRIYDILKVGNYLELNLTENYSMNPTSSIMGFIIQNEKAEYFSVGKIGPDQLIDYSKRTGLSIERIGELIPNNV